MSVVSPYNGSCAYIMPMPLSNMPMVDFSNDTLTSMVPIYPAKGTAFLYTEQCIRVTGTMKYGQVTTDENKYEYSWYLADCSYDVVAPTDAIAEYNLCINNGSMGVIDGWLSQIFKGLQDTEQAEIVDPLEFETKLLQAEITDTLKQVSSKVNALNASYNKWVEAGAKTEGAEYSAMQDSYAEVNTSINEWLSTLKVRGDEH